MKYLRLLRVFRWGVTLNEGGYAPGYAPARTGSCPVIFAVTWSRQYGLFWYLAIWSFRRKTWDWWKWHR
jgi:hypothetical protein